MLPFAGPAAIILVLLALVNPTSNNSHAFVFLTSPDCDDRIETYERNFQLPSPDIDRYIKGYQIVCFGGINNFWIVDNITLPILRFIYPDKIFVFVFPDSQSPEFTKFLDAKLSSQLQNHPIGDLLKGGFRAANGYSDIEKGVGYALDGYPYYAKHELAHLWICGTWHDSNARPLTNLQFYPGADKLPWCTYHPFPD